MCGVCGFAALPLGLCLGEDGKSSMPLNLPMYRLSVDSRFPLGLAFMAGMVELGACARSSWRWPWFHVTGFGVVCSLVGIGGGGIFQSHVFFVYSFWSWDSWDLGFIQLGLWSMSGFIGGRNLIMQSASGSDSDVWSLTIRTFFKLRL